MHRQGAQLLGERLAQKYPQLMVEVYQDQARASAWLAQVYDPATGRTLTFETENEALRSLGEERGGARANRG